MLHKMPKWDRKCWAIEDIVLTRISLRQKCSCRRAFPSFTITAALQRAFQKRTFSLGAVFGQWFLHQELKVSELQTLWTQGRSAYLTSPWALAFTWLSTHHTNSPRSTWTSLEIFFLKQPVFHNVFQASNIISYIKYSYQLGFQL